MPMEQGTLTQQTERGQTAAPRQSMYLLRLPLLALNDYVAERAMDNPMLDVESGTASFLENIDDLLQREESSWKEDLAGDIFEQTRNSRGEEERDGFAERLSGPETLKDHLLRQLEEDQRLSESYQFMCTFLVESLDPRGYLTESIEELALCMDVTPEEAMQALYVIQDLSPAGVGARSLQECLVLQLASGKHFNAYTIRIVNEYLPLLARGDLDAVTEALGIPRQEAEAWCDVVRNLNPIPGRGFSGGEQGMFTVPEASAEYENGEFFIVCNTQVLPKVTINPEYRKLMDGGAEGESEEVQAYLRENYAKAKELIHALAFREATLTAVIRYILTTQKEYLLGNRPEPVPLTIGEIADALSLHAGTVSRAVKEKYIVWSRRVLPLKELLSASVHREETVSAPMIERLIRRTIEAEDRAHPLTDDDITRALHALNISVTSGAVTDFRTQMDIPPADLRRNS